MPDLLTAEGQAIYELRCQMDRIALSADAICQGRDQDKRRQRQIIYDNIARYHTEINKDCEVEGEEVRKLEHRWAALQEQKDWIGQMVKHQAQRVGIQSGDADEIEKMMKEMRASEEAASGQAACMQAQGSAI